MSDEKIKTATDKVPLDLVPLHALVGAARVFGYGARKYAPGNFYTADDSNSVQRYIGAALRHLSAMQRPDGLCDMTSVGALDVESGLPEIDHAICGLIMLRALATKHGALQVDPGVGSTTAFEKKLKQHLDSHVQCRSSSEPVFDAEPEIHRDRCATIHPEHGMCTKPWQHATPGTTEALTQGLSHRASNKETWR